MTSKQIEFNDDDYWKEVKIKRSAAREIEENSIRIDNSSWKVAFNLFLFLTN